MATQTTGTAASEKRGRGRTGQSVVEFAIILPILLTLFGAALDFSRVYFVDLNVQSATRNAVEFVATDPTLTTLGAAQARAQELVCTEIVGVPNCSGEEAPVAVVTYFSVSTTAPGATVKNPIATITLRVSQPFTMFFPYPFMSPPGHWDLTAETTFSVARNR
jgi:Flp pilus assembly protein TadG